MHVLSEIHQPDVDIETLLPWNVSLN
ncbi:MAG: hypothetical protein P8Q24_07420 [Glaciecola sp.]|nr:hypothetical protein [Glaciecola sp.]